MKPWQKVVGWSALAAALLGIFGLYGRPDFLLTVANQIWGCF